jgi:hypothetical protein
MSHDGRDLEQLRPEPRLATPQDHAMKVKRRRKKNRESRTVQARRRLARRRTS